MIALFGPVDVEQVLERERANDEERRENMAKTRL
jgi:hypothetical protein